MKPSLRIIIGNLSIGGAERHLSQILPLLMAKNYRIKVLTLKKSAKNNFCDELRKAGVVVKEPPAMRVLDRLFRLFWVPLYVWFDYCRDRQSITHYFLPEAYLIGGYLAYLSLSRSPKIMSRRSLNYYQDKRRLFKYLERKLHHCLTVVLGNSQAVVRQLVTEGIPEEKTRLIYNGIDVSLFEKTRSRVAVRSELGLSDGQCVFIMVANLISYKGHADLIEAFALIQNRLPKEWCMLCVGRDDGLLPALQEKVRQHALEQHFFWLGVRRDVPDLLNAADVGVLCSHEEGFSNAVLEGMAASLPMVVTNVGGNPDAVISNETGFIVPPKNPEKLAEGLLELACDLNKAQAFGGAGYQRVKSVFNLEKCVSSYDDLYRAL